MAPRRFRMTYPSDSNCDAGQEFCGSRRVTIDFDEFVTEASIDASEFTWSHAVDGPFQRVDGALNYFNESVCASTRMYTDRVGHQGPAIPTQMRIYGKNPWVKKENAPMSTNMCACGTGG